MTSTGKAPIHSYRLLTAARLAFLLVIIHLSSNVGIANAAPASNRIEIEYAVPKDPAHEALAALAKEHRVLEELQKVLSPIKLPRKLRLRLVSCNGEANAYYEDNAVQVCYELLQEIRSNAPKEKTPAGVEPADAVAGPVLFVFLHETGHALFDMLQIPSFGSEEDAADQIAAYLLLNLEQSKARRMIMGAAYVHRKDLQQEIKLELKEFAEEHGLPAQRFFNLLCIAYGADKKLFADFVEKGYLPKERSEGCGTEYEQVAYAFQKLIAPHIDRALQMKLRAQRWIRSVAKRPAPKVKSAQ